MAGGSDSEWLRIVLPLFHTLQVGKKGSQPIYITIPLNQMGATDDSLFLDG